MALAKLGVERDLFEIECETQPAATNYTRLFAIKDKLHYVGGWFAIRLAMGMLSDTGENHKGLNYSDDLNPDWYPQQLAIDILPDLLGPDLNTRLVECYGVSNRVHDARRSPAQAQIVESWHQWLLDHEDKLRTLKPTGEYVRYSEQRCTNYLKSQKALLPSKISKPD
jgi:hypothetical protein